MNGGRPLPPSHQGTYPYNLQPTNENGELWSTTPNNTNQFSPHATHFPYYPSTHQGYEWYSNQDSTSGVPHISGGNIATGHPAQDVYMVPQQSYQLSPRMNPTVMTSSPAYASTSTSPSPNYDNSAYHHSQSELVGVQLYTHRQQMQFFRDVFNLPLPANAGPFVPQMMYRPQTTSDRRRYVEEVELEPPIYFWMTDPDEYGISLIDALRSRVKRLHNRNETVFHNRGPSVSIRLEWPGYRQWSRQIPTKDFRSPPGPITRAKLAKNVARCVMRFIDDRRNQPMDDGADLRWKVGTEPDIGEITLDDLILVSMHHVSLGSWQPQFRLRRPLPTRSTGF